MLEQHEDTWMKELTDKQATIDELNRKLRVSSGKYMRLKKTKQNKTKKLALGEFLLLLHEKRHNGCGNCDGQKTCCIA
jgi:hypothetical protein